MWSVVCSRLMRVNRQPVHSWNGVAFLRLGVALHALSESNDDTQIHCVAGAVRGFSSWRKAKLTEETAWKRLPKSNFQR